MITTSSMMMFLVVILVAAVVLFGVVAGSQNRRRSGRGRGAGRYSQPRLSQAQIAERWSVIQATAAGGGNGLRTAVSEADKLFDQALRQQNLPGETMGDRLKAAKNRFSSYSIYDAVWRAHKLRNSLAHEVGFDLVPSQAKEALSDFERGLKDLGVL